MDNFSSLAKLMIAIGVFLVLGGGLLLLLGKVGIPLGRLPGDISYHKGSFSFYFPLVTCLVLSLVLTLVLNFLLRR
ncbi:MAG TPA: DUF2905 domain-containing protein [Peptococcaceae bacterium]|jgi:hypothetical protein|nr:DUF2905 domain-containing protein [Peptococcaceae bacterium]